MTVVHTDLVGKPKEHWEAEDLRRYTILIGVVVCCYMHAAYVLGGRVGVGEARSVALDTV